MKSRFAFLPIVHCLWPIACCLLLYSCYTPRYVYSPTAHNVPVLVKKGDSKLAANYSANIAGNTHHSDVDTKGTSSGYDLQGAYAVSNHFALQLNYYHRNERNAGDFDAGFRDSVIINYKRSLTEIGAGYFHVLNKNAIVQVFGGVGFGKSSFVDNGRDQYNVYRTKHHMMDVTKIFIQPALSVKIERYVASFSSRLSIIYFKNIKTDYDAAELDNYKLDSLSYSPRAFWEPCMVNTFGFKKLPGLQVEFQMGFAFLVSQRFVDARSFNFSAGLLFDLPKLFAFNHHSSKN